MRRGNKVGADHSKKSALSHTNINRCEYLDSGISGFLMKNKIDKAMNRSYLLNIPHSEIKIYAYDINPAEFLSDYYVAM